MKTDLPFLRDKRISLERKRIHQELKSVDQEPPQCDESLKTITIGITARNEERTIRQTINSIIVSASLLPKWVKYEISVCLNDCSDGTDSVLDKVIKNHVSITKLKSTQGKIEAQRQIIQNRQYKEGVAFFFDADIVVDRLCVPALWIDLLLHEQIQVCYATVVPFYSEERSLISKVMSLHYEYPELQTRRYYFYGRAFAIRNWSVPDFSNPDMLPERQKSVFVKNRFSYLRLEKGPLIDDVYLSRQICHEYGLETIKQNWGAIVYFTPVTSLADYYYGYRRLWIELERLDFLFPEHSYLQKRYFQRKTYWYEIKKLNCEAKLLFMLKKMLEKGVKIIYLLDIFLVITRIYTVLEIWKPLKSTKKPLPNLTNLIDEVCHEK